VRNLEHDRTIAGVVERAYLPTVPNARAETPETSDCVTNTARAALIEIVRAADAALLEGDVARARCLLVTLLRRLDPGGA
jgi:hypothetical protein